MKWKIKKINIIAQIAMNYGLEHQLIKTLEELGELSTAISKAVLSRTSEDIENVVLPDYVLEEIADARIMLAQLIALTNSEDKIDNYVQQKLNRQVERIADEQRVYLKNL